APDERFDLVLADPPYVPRDEVARWPDDPVAAIDGGADGLDLVRVCLDLADAHLTGRGRMLLQVAGPAQADEVARLLAERGCPLVADERRVVDERRAIVRLSRP